MKSRPMKRNSAQEALPLDFCEPPMPDPEACEFERSRWKGKTCCMFRGSEIWTNCREFGRCVWDGWHQQGASDAIYGEEDG